MPAALLRELQAKVHAAAARLVYADGATQPPQQQQRQTDAVDVLVDQMRRVHGVKKRGGLPRGSEHEPTAATLKRKSLSSGMAACSMRRWQRRWW